MDCPNCEHAQGHDFCPKCGRATQPRRIDGRYIIEEIAAVLTFRKGLLFTIWELLIRPGKNVKSFIKEDRNRLVKPVIFLIFCSFIYTVLQQELRFEDGYVNMQSDDESSAMVTIFEWIQGNYGYSNILMALFIAFWIRLLFRKHGYNFYESLILLLFIFGIMMLVYSFFGILEVAFEIPVLHIGGILGFIYASWAIAQFHDEKKVLNYFKAAFAYLLGFMTFFMLAVGLGTLIDTLT